MGVDVEWSKSLPGGREKLVLLEKVKVRGGLPVRIAPSFSGSSGCYGRLR
jgi:hypothetical protein